MSERKRFDPEDTGSQSRHMVFAPEVDVYFPKTGDVTTTFLVLPAMPFEPIEGWDCPYESQYVPYKRFDCEPRDNWRYPFSEWSKPYHVHEWVGGKRNIIAPNSYNNENICRQTDLVRVLADHVADRGRWELLGLGPDGKRTQDRELADALFESKVLNRYSSTKYMMNISVIGPDGPGETVLGVFPDSAISPRRNSKDSDKTPNHGLFAELHKLSRNVSEEKIKEDPSFRFHWGDITNPQCAVPVSLFKETSNTGGAVKVWVARPTDLNVRTISAKNLAKRKDLFSDGLFIHYDSNEVLQELIKLFYNDHADLLIGAFSSTYPIRRMLDEFSGGGSDDDDIPMHREERPAPAPASRPASTGPVRSYAPSADKAMSLSKMMWVSVNKATPVKMSEADAMAEAAKLPDGEVKFMPEDRSKPWGSASAYGFKFFEPPPPLDEPPPPPEDEPPAAEETPPPPPAEETPPLPPSDDPPAKAAAKPSSPPPVIESREEQAPAPTSNVSVDMLRRQLGSSSPQSSGEDAPPPPPPR